jgi:hypothetical protein
VVPNDLQPIPTQPWDERPASLPLEEEEVRTALWLNRGNISQSAALLKVTSARLRNYVNAKPRLLAEQKEARERLLDQAESVAAEALFDPADAGRRDGMAKFLLNSALGKLRGLGTGGSGPVVNVRNIGPMIIEWSDGKEIHESTDDGVIIEGDKVS